MILIIVAAFVLRSPAVRDRFYSNDEATYSTLSARILSGAVMYAGAVDHKPPGIAYLYAGVYKVVGVYHLPAVRLVVTTMVALTGIVLSELAANMTGVTLARAAGLLYVLISATGFAPNTQAANTELVLNLPISLAAFAVYSCSREERVSRAWLLACAAGVATGAATLFKYQAALAGVAWVLWLLSSRRKTTIAAGTTGLAIGFAAVGIAVVASFAATSHLDAFLFWGWRYNFQYITSLPFRSEAIRFVVETVPIALMWLPAVALAACSRDRVSLAWWWLGATGVAVSIGGRFFGNYFLMMAPPLAVLAGAGVARMHHARRPLATSLAAIAAVLAVASALAATVWDRFQPSERAIDLQYRAAGDWIRAHTSPGDSLLVWGDSPQIYVYSQRLMGTRFAFTNYQTGTIWGVGAWPGRPAPTMPELAVPRAWDELLEDMQTAPPRVIADAAAGGLHNFDGQSLDRFPRLWKIVANRYRYETTVGGVRIYRRID